MAKSLQALINKAAMLKQRGRLSEAIAVYRQAVKRYPDSGVAEHNLAGALGDAGRAPEAEAHIRRAFRKGLNAPQSWLIFARALMTQGKTGEAQAAYAKTIELNPGLLDAQQEMAQLIWMLTGDAHAALARLDETITAHPDEPSLHYIKAQALRYIEGHAAAFAYCESLLQQWPNDTTLLTHTATSATFAGKIEDALQMSRRLADLQPDSGTALECRVTALLAAGQAGEALSVVEQLMNTNRYDQHTIALLATTYRLLGDDRYAELHDYDDFVRPYTLTTPKGWSSLVGYLNDLRSALAERHPYKSHPFRNSLEGGSMIMDFAGVDNVAIRALSQALTPAIDAHLQHLGKGDDILRSRNTGNWTFNGIWSVYLQPNGFHHDHVHPSGWLSSACYIELPDRLKTGEKEGWIKFGEPGIVTQPKLNWDHAVKPEVGTIVIFPSYMWHGTIPFGGEQRRMTCALDITPA
jgi:tetratricopeptide (TPR) repeat protein